MRPLRIAVTGATGTIGRRVVRRLAAGHHVRALSRDPERAARAGTAGEIVGADLGDAPSLLRAVEGADALFAVTFDPERPGHDERLLAAARKGGVRRVVKLSALAVNDQDAQDLITRWQRECEERLRASGLEWVLVRPRAFMSQTLGWARSVREEGVVRGLYGTSRNSCIDPDDVASVAAEALTAPEHAHRVHELTGPEPISAEEQTGQLARALGRPLRFEELRPAQAREAWTARFSAPVAQALLESAERQAAGAKAQVSDGVRRVTGRAPGTYAAWARRHADAFR